MRLSESTWWSHVHLSIHVTMAVIRKKQGGGGDGGYSVSILKGDWAAGGRGALGLVGM